MPTRAIRTGESARPSDTENAKRRVSPSGSSATLLKVKRDSAS